MEARPSLESPLTYVFGFCRNGSERYTRYCPIRFGIANSTVDRVSRVKPSISRVPSGPTPLRSFTGFSGPFSRFWLWRAFQSAKVNRFDSGRGLFVFKRSRDNSFPFRTETTVVVFFFLARCRSRVACIGKWYFVGDPFVRSVFSPYVFLAANRPCRKYGHRCSGNHRNSDKQLCTYSIAACSRPSTPPP